MSSFGIHKCIIRKSSGSTSNVHLEIVVYRFTKKKQTSIGVSLRSAAATRVSIFRADPNPVV
jgi:hypothetical protein